VWVITDSHVKTVTVVQQSCGHEPHVSPQVVSHDPSPHVMGSIPHPVTGSHESVVQTSPSSQTIGENTQPVAGSQASFVQMLASSQVIGKCAQPTPAIQ